MWLDHIAHWQHQPQIWRLPHSSESKIYDDTRERFMFMENIIDEIYHKMPTKRMKP